MKIRGYKGTYYEQVKRQNTPKTGLIKRLTDALLSPSNNHNVIKQEFKNYETLITNFDDKTKKQWQKVDNLIDKTKITALHTVILLFYNILFCFFPVDYINEFINRIEIVETIDDNPLIWGQANINLEIKLKKITLNISTETIITKDYNSGWFSTNNFFHPLIHELAHIIYFYDKNHKIDQVAQLKQFLRQKISSIADFPQLNDDIIWKLFANSTYSQKNESDLIAEGFTYWLLTPKALKTTIADIWGEFYLSYLPQVRNKWR